MKLDQYQIPLIVIFTQLSCIQEVLTSEFDCWRYSR